MSTNSDAMTLRLKIGESNRRCSHCKNETIRRVKQCQFPAENVRFICQGRELDDDLTIEELRLTESSVIHVVVRSARYDSPSSNQSTSRGLFPEPDMDPCAVLAIFLGLTILLGLMLAASLPELFNSFSWIILTAYSLAGISFISVIIKNRINTPL
eukprot:gene1158-2250_t